MYHAPSFRPPVGAKFDHQIVALPAIRARQIEGIFDGATRMIGVQCSAPNRKVCVQPRSLMLPRQTSPMQQQVASRTVA
jgi:hypothetical protein